MAAGDPMDFMRLDEIRRNKKVLADTTRGLQQTADPTKRAVLQEILDQTIARIAQLEKE